MADSTPSLGFSGQDIADVVLEWTIDVDARSGAAAIAVVVPLTPGRAGITPNLTLKTSGQGAGSPFGDGWSLDAAPSISVAGRAQTLPRYDASDVYFADGNELTLVPSSVEVREGFAVRRYRAVVDTANVRFEQWCEIATGRIHWRARHPDGSVVIYGARSDGTSRIADPDDTRRVSHWQGELRVDRRGHAVRYDYIAETSAGVDPALPQEYPRLVATGFAQRYLKRIRYGNTRPIAADGIEAADNAWLFEVVLDYGDHAGAHPGPVADQAWPVRASPRSSFRSGFEIRTYRLCRRILMFHHMAPLGPGATLVAATSLAHSDMATATRLDAVHRTGYRREADGTITSRAQPPVVFTYTTTQPGAAFETASSEAEENVPGGLSGRQQWVDLAGDGLPGILSQQDRVWYYKRNEGGGRFARQLALAQTPAQRPGQFVVGDFDRDGNVDLSSHAGRVAGFFERDRDEPAWSGFRTFATMPHLEAAGARAQWLDLDGDGRAELVIAHADRFVWYPALGKDGFGEAIEIPKPQTASAVIAEDPQLELYFADMTGDGLADLVRVQQGRVEYWPHLGHGRFGAPIAIDGAELLGLVPQFDPARIRFVDLDGSGTSDLVYLGRGEIQIFYNAGGNRLVAGPRISHLPYIDNLSSAHVLDFLGDGASHLVWSSPLAGRGNAIHYLPLTTTTPAPLVATISSSMGREVHFAYASSAAHYLRDRERGAEWKSLLPQHHTVVEQVELRDLVTGTRAISRYEYHDGVFDGEQRRFRCFTHVDHFNSPITLEPDEPTTANACTRMWFHPGTARWERSLVDTYTGDPLLPRLAGHELAEPALSGIEHAAALRALAGQAIRTEVFAVDDQGVLAPHPFRVDQQRYLVRRLHAAVEQHEPSFTVHTVESTSHVYEQHAGDPRVTHHVGLEIDDYGVEIVGLDIGYPRRAGATDAVPAQNQAIVQLARRGVCHRDDSDRYEIGIAISEETFEITGLPPTGAALHDRAALATMIVPALAAPLRFDELATSGVEARRVEWQRTRYWNATRDAMLPLGEVGPIALVHHDETAVFTPELVASAYGGRVDPALLSELFYVAADGHWWASEVVHHLAGPDQFFTLERGERANGATITYAYDPLLLAASEIVDAAGNRTLYELDYHVLRYRRIVDPNENVREVAYDPLGTAVVTTATGHVMAADGNVRPYGHQPITTVSTTTFEQVLADPAAFVGQAERAVCYELDATPPRAVTVEREQLVHDGAGSVTPSGPVRVIVTYFDGMLRPIQTKVLSGPGPAIQRDDNDAIMLGADGAPVLVESDSRWQSTGHVVLDDKQRPARLFEPFFTTTADYESDDVLQRFGVAHEYVYDAMGRQVREHVANGAFQRTVFAAWQTIVFDANDTVDESAYRITRELLPASDPERRALAKAMAHAQTPSTRALDVLGREVVQIEIDEGGVERVTTVTLDRTGTPLQVVDPRGVIALRNRLAMTGLAITTVTSDAGQAWRLDDALGRTRHGWSARGLQREHHFDALDRVIAVDVITGAEVRRVEQRTYGDSAGAQDAGARNVRDRLIEIRDEAGVTRIRAYTPDGEVLGSEQQVCSMYRSEPDWNADVALDPTVYRTENRYDARARPVMRNLPDGTTRRFEYQAGGGFERLSISSSDGVLVDVPIITGATFDARGERERTQLGNGVVIEREYDRETFALRAMRARQASGRVLLDLAYTRDPMGHVVEVVDAAQEPGAPLPLLEGLSISTRSEYRYDSLYRLLEATGRNHQALLEHDRGAHHIHLNNGAAVERYTRTYSYDAAGNRTSIQHVGVTRSWTTTMWVSPTSNRSLAALDDNGNPTAEPESRFDAAGNLLSMPHLRALEWNHADRLRRVVTIDRSGTGDPDDAEYYVYGADGARVRKVTERLVAGQLEVTEKLYLDECEIKRVTRGATPLLERTTSHVSGGEGRIAMIHRWTRDDLARETDDIAAPRFHYTIASAVGSSVLELDAVGDVIHYEEFFPFGGSAFIAGDDERSATLKEYRYAGKERDDASGFYDYGQRYYVPWLGRWLNCDPIGPEDGLNLYEFVHGDPINRVDPDGTEDEPVIKRSTVKQIPKEYAAALKRLPAEQQKAWMRGEGHIVPLPGKGFVYLTNAEWAQKRDELMKLNGSLEIREMTFDQPTQARAPTEESKPAAEQEIVVPIEIHKDYAILGGTGKIDAGAGGPQGEAKASEPGDDAKPGNGGSQNTGSGNAGNVNAGANPNGINNQASAAAQPNQGGATLGTGTDPKAQSPTGSAQASTGRSTDPNVPPGQARNAALPQGSAQSKPSAQGSKQGQGRGSGAGGSSGGKGRPGGRGGGQATERLPGARPGGMAGGVEDGVVGGIAGGTGSPIDLVLPGRIAEPGEQPVIGDGDVGGNAGTVPAIAQPSDRRSQQRPLDTPASVPRRSPGGSPTGSPGGAPGGNGGTNPPPTNGQQPNAFDKITNVVGYADLEFSGGSATGESGGVPGAVGSLNLGKPGQVAYWVNSILGAVFMVGAIAKVGAKGVTKGVQKATELADLVRRTGAIQWELLRKGAFTAGKGLRFGSPRYFKHVWKGFKSTVGLTAVEVNGKLTVFITHTSPDAYKALKEGLVKLAPNEKLAGIAPKLGADGKVLKHAEQMGIEWARSLGLRKGWVATSNLGCPNCLAWMARFKGNWTHLNPK